MADILAELVARITADVSDLKKGLAEAEKNVESFAQKNQEGFKSADTNINKISDSLKGVTGDTDKTAKSTESLSYTYTGFGRAIRSIIPSATEFKNILDSTIPLADKMTGVLQGVGQGFSYLALQSKMSMGQQTLAIGSLNAGLGILGIGLDLLKKHDETYRQVAEANAAEIKKHQDMAAFTAQNLSKYELEVAESFGVVTKEMQTQGKILEWINKLSGLGFNGEQISDMINKTLSLANADNTAENALKKYNDALFSLKDSLGVATEAEQQEAMALQLIDTFAKSAGISHEQAATQVEFFMQKVRAASEAANVGKDAYTNLIRSFGFLNSEQERAISQSRAIAEYNLAHPGEDAARIFNENITRGITGMPPSEWGTTGFHVDPLTGISGYAEGGTVPGPMGKPQLAVVHGGEQITPAGEGGGVVINNYVQGSVVTERELGNIVWKYLLKKQKSEYSTGIT